MDFQALFSHHAGIQPWLPFYKNTLSEKTSRPQKNFYRNKQKRKHALQVSENLFLRTNYLEEIKDEILGSPLLDSLYYKYSDLPFYMFKEYIEERYDQRMDKLVEKEFYAPIGASHLGYLPLQEVDVSQVVPSEIDDYYRHSEIQGFVHDMGAAMQNGIGGHAGLFSNANDVAKMMQMFMQGGSYGGVTISLLLQLATSTPDTTKMKTTVAGLALTNSSLRILVQLVCAHPIKVLVIRDLQELLPGQIPAYDLVYVFLSNRTYPTMENTKLVDVNLRSEIQRVIYKAMIQ